ncbi:MAG: hypothetical protein BGN96_00560 [Bacteroidales bacterium 45-6]|nr:MAG: hypothetical protein BGN96_00560 [Bacteroidales bacterium 45-6]
MSVVFSPESEGYLYETIEILYKLEYFGHKESAVKYVIDLAHEIRDTLPNCLKKQAPAYFERYGKGMYYSVFKKNNNTSWYVFFNHEDGIYYIRYIGNNHTCSHYLP